MNTNELTKSKERIAERAWDAIEHGLRYEGVRIDGKAIILSAIDRSNEFVTLEEAQIEATRLRPVEPVKDKREVILEFHSSPDAILNALHQAGWQIIPKSK